MSNSQPLPETNILIDAVHKNAAVIIMLLAVVVCLKLAADFLVPVSIAMFLVALAWPIKTYLNQHLPNSLSSFGSLLALAAVLAVFIGAMYFSSIELLQTLPKYQDELSQFWKTTKYELALKGVDTSSKPKMEDVQLFVGHILKDFHKTLLTLILVLAYFTLALPEMTQWKEKLQDCLGRERSERIILTAEQLGKSFQNYLAAMVISGIISAIATYFAVIALGLDFVVTWTIMAFLLSFIPIIGAFLTIIPPTLLSIVQFGGYEMPMTVLVTLGVIHLFLGNFVEPRIQGKMLALSPVIVLLSLSFWGLLWGIPGAILAAPLSQGVIIACSHFERTRWIACLLSDRPQSEFYKKPMIILPDSVAV